MESYTKCDGELQDIEFPSKLIPTPQYCYFFQGYPMLALVFEDNRKQKRSFSLASYFLIMNNEKDHKYNL